MLGVVLIGMLWVGVGEGGEGVESSMQERNSPKFQQFYRENGFYGFVSDNISLDRSVNDIRHPEYAFVLYHHHHQQQRASTV